MKIKDLYKKYDIHPSLQIHMIRVAKVADQIIKHWNGPKIDSVEVIKLCLVHDLGNIVRMNLDDEYWVTKKNEVIDKYGNVDDIVTQKILEEVDVSQQTIKTILDKRFSNSIKIFKSNDWALKILLYSDLRVTPYSITSLKERLDEVLLRRPDLKKLHNIDELVKACVGIEKQIQKNVGFLLSSISEESVERDESKFLTIEI